MSIEDQHRKVMASWRGNVTEEVMAQDVRDLLLACDDEKSQLIGQFFLPDGGPTAAAGAAIQNFRHRLEVLA